MLDRYWWLAYAGSGVIAWTSADLMLAEPMTIDPLAAVGLVFEQVDAAGQLVHGPTATGYSLMLAVTALTLLAAHYFHRHRPAMARERA